MRFGEINGSFEVFFHLAERRKLGTIVERNALYRKAFPEEFLKRLLTGSKIIFTNEVEREIIEKIYGFEDITELFDIGEVEIIVTTLGKDGSLCYIREGDIIRQEKDRKSVV